MALFLFLFLDDIEDIQQEMSRADSITKNLDAMLSELDFVGSPLE